MNLKEICGNAVGMGRVKRADTACTFFTATVDMEKLRRVQESYSKSYNAKQEKREERVRKAEIKLAKSNVFYR